MNKNTIKVVGIIFFLIIGLLILTKNFEKYGFGKSKNSLKNFSVIVSGQKFDLINGRAEVEFAPNSATKNKVYIFGEPVTGDLNGDGKDDAAEFLVNEPGGSGSFFYAVLLINQGDSYKATETMFLGDRIAPQNINIIDGRAVYNFAERKAGEPFSTPPSVGRSVWVHLDTKTNQIGEWVKDFEGETDLVVYKNDKYGFSFTLPKSWAGYKIVESAWQGFDTNSTYEKPAPTETGKIIYIRHPLWTESKPRQDIPVMVFTLAQWEKVSKEELSVSAAPIPPTELGRNTKYVFALPARYNYAFPEGFEEVEKIIEGNNFKAY